MTDERTSVAMRKDCAWYLVANKKVTRCIDGGASLLFEQYPKGRINEAWVSITERENISYAVPHEFLS